MDKIKIRIKDEFHSRQVQDLMFSMGYGWWNNGELCHEYEHLQEPFLFGEEDGSIMYCGNGNDFFSDTNDEVELASYFTPYVERAKMTLYGKEYYCDDIKEVLKQLEPVEQGE